ncbi:hypothetical protein Q4I28_002404 [Leishmania naiffi]|uniref:Uncharacterized protein n=1 Tax=Leishmania naiffi TaxID=5678 RepID=A0AAW3BYN1_9TRYP
MGGGVELPATCGGGGAGLRVRGFVVDARTRGVPVRSAAALRDALAAPAQTLSLEDFRAVAVGPSERCHCSFPSSRHRTYATTCFGVVAQIAAWSL